MKNELVTAINQICNERNLPLEIIVEAIETALVSAYKKNFGGGQNIKAMIDMKTGVPTVFTERIVVEQVDDERFEISMDEALKVAPDAKLGSLVQVDITPRSFGRIAAQTAKQVILQRIREAERDVLFSSYADREGELITGMVASITPYAIALNLGRTEAVMPRSQQVPRERYRIGQRVRAYVMEVRRTNRGPQIVVSRTHRNMLRRLLELEVPEVFSGTVEIKGISREAGSRSKVAVTAIQEGVDPVGSCVGIRGMRIQSIVSELGGEKIDIVEWNADTSTFIANALSPAKVNYAVLSEKPGDRTATVVVPDDQLSLAIGKEGQNARLAAKLTGWRIDIKSASEAASEELKLPKHVAAVSGEQKDILAMAKAILLGKEPAEEIVPPEPEAEPLAAKSVAEETTELEPALAAAAEQETLALTATESVSSDQEPEKEKEEPPEQVPAQIAPETTEPVLEREPIVVPPKPKYEYVADEELESAKTSKEKARRKRRELVLDEESGEVIAKRRRKRSTKPGKYDWEDLIDR